MDANIFLSSANTINLTHNVIDALVRMIYIYERTKVDQE